MNKGFKIYIAGHRGMVGSAIMRKLIQNGYKNLVTRTHRELDLTNQSQVAAFFETEKPEFVFLAAAKVGGIVANNIYRADFIYENIMIQSNVINQCHLHKVKKMIFMGSSCIYPKMAPQPIKEESLLSSSLEATNEPYALAKIAGLKMCENYDRQYGCNFFSVMPCNLYGPFDNFNLKHSHVLSGLMRKMHLAKCIEQNNWDAIRHDLNKNPIGDIDGTAKNEDILKILTVNGIHTEPEVIVDVWGSGEVLREFLFVEDLADAVYFLFENYNISHETEKAENNNYYFNIGSGVDLTINELAKKIKIVTGYNGKLLNDLTKPDGTPRKLLDVSRMEELGWKYTTKLEEGITAMYNWYLTN
jgi:GDP-L-fucose synthase